MLKSVLGADVVNDLGRACGQSKRLRVVTPARLAVTMIGALAGGAITSIADLLREFNYQHRTTVAYKAFYNRLAHKGFPTFMREMVSCMLTELAMRILTPDPESPLAKFKDIVIQDGTSFALKETLQGVFPGRFKTVEPAAVELHATYSGLEDQVTRVFLTPDTDAERHYLPEPAELRNKLLLADRGYPALPYFKDVDRCGGSFIMRLSRSWKPYVTAVYHRKRCSILRKPIPLDSFLSQNPNRALDLDAAFGKGKKRTVFRLIILPAKEPAMTRLCTNLPRDRFSIDTVSKLYRFRWQVEICFKEWKSHANLHAFDTANPHIAEGFIWASLCAAVLKRFLAHAAQVAGNVPISTQRVAACVKTFIRDLLGAIDRSPWKLSSVIASSMEFLLKNATRAHPERDRTKGRQNIGLALVGGGLK